MIYFKLKRQGFNMRFSDSREYYATFMTKFLNPAEIDFLQGRLSTSVFMKNYSNPVLIKDLRRRVFPGISKWKRLYLKLCQLFSLVFRNLTRLKD